MSSQVTGRNDVHYEETLTDAIVDYLRRTCLRFGWQVPALDGRIDFVGVRSSYEVIAIEVKTSRWRKALSQARNYLLCSDKAYVALPSSVAFRAAKQPNLFREWGVGLISVDDYARVVIGAKKSQLNIPSLRSHLIRVTRERRCKSHEMLSRRLTEYDSMLGMASRRQGTALFAKNARMESR